MLLWNSQYDDYGHGDDYVLPDTIGVQKVDRARGHEKEADPRCLFLLFTSVVKGPA